MRIPQRLKGKFYRSVVRPTILYGLECRAVGRKIEYRMSVAEMRMLGWISSDKTEMI